MRMVYIDLVSYDPEYQGGVGTYVRGIVPELVKQNQTQEVTILYVKNNEQSIRELGLANCNYLRVTPSSVHLVSILYKINYRLLGWVWLLAFTQHLQWRNLIKLLKIKASLIYTPTTYINFRVSTAKHIVSLHDTQEKAYPEYFTTIQKRYRNVNVINTLKSVSLLQSSSRFIQSQIQYYYKGYLGNKPIVVIPEGVYSDTHVSDSFDLEKGLDLFCPASFSHHKRQDVLLDSISTLSQNVVRNVQLTGDWNNVYGMQLFKTFSIDPRVNFTGYVSRNEIEELYSQSNAVISCSEYESSSLPILEGASRGKILIASDIEAHKEMGEYLHIFYFKTGSPQSLKNVLQGVSLLSMDELNDIRRANMVSVRSLSWKVAAERYWNAFTKLLV